jgi:hypothetical protein
MVRKTKLLHGEDNTEDTNLKDNNNGKIHSFGWGYKLKLKMTLLGGLQV